MTLHSTFDTSTETEVFAFPASFAQQRLWFLDQLEPETPQYNIPAAVHISGQLNVAALEWSFQQLVQRHETLRTTFATVDGQPVQVIHPSWDFQLSVVNPLPLYGEGAGGEAQNFLSQEAQQPFNLETGPLFRATLIKLSDKEHLLLITMHHIISDGWSMGILVREIAALYESFTANQPYNLPELPIQYADFSVWQREWLEQQALTTQLAYWQHQLDGLSQLQLPTDRPHSIKQTSQGDKQTLVLNKILTDALKKLSQQAGVTLFMTLLAAFKTLLYRYTGQDDIVVGSPIANRTRLETQGLIGFFVNTLVLRTDLSHNPTFQELLSRVRQVTLAAYENQDLPFEKLVDELQPERDLSRNPLFQVWFALNNAPMPALQVSGLTISPLEVDRKAASFDFSLDMMEQEEGLVAVVEYSTDLFDSSTITRMLGHFQTLLTGIVANSEQRLSNLPLLSGTERHKLLVEFNQNQSKIKNQKLKIGQCIHHLFEAQVEKTPDAVAVVFENQHLTYRELNQQADELAGYLQKLGVCPENIVGICVERSLEMVVGILGILKAGSAYLPLDPAYPQERLGFMVEDAKISILLTQKRLLNTLPNHNAVVVCLDDDWRLKQEEKSQSPITQPYGKGYAQHPSPTTLAYVIYTSGSTGKAKGVMVQHSSLVNAYLAWEDAYELRSHTTSHLQMASFSFDVFSGDWVRALCSGGKLVLCPREFLLDPPQLYQLMVEQKVDCAEFVPAVLRNLVQYLEQSQQRLDFMQLLVCGSDSWYVQEYKQIRQLCGANTRLINSFGVTEATIDSCYFESAAIDLPVEQLVPIGRPFTNTQLYILDKHLQLVPIGVIGELYIGGAGLARGYLNRPDLTTEKFIPNPFDPLNLSRLYKTGDLARYLPDGNIEFFGRIDHQVKIRGFRIELGEIETSLNQHPAVKETVVLAREDERGKKRLVAYIVPWDTAPTSPLSPSLLRSFLKEQLPDYMVPSAFVLLEAMPLTPNGKVDRKSLPAPDKNVFEVEETFVSPRTTVEQTLAKIWAEVLGLERVGIRDNFFELGGDSIISIQAIARANQAGIRLTPKQLFQHQTIAELATVAGTAQGIQAQQGIVKGTVPLTPIQHWFFEENFLDAHHWNQAILLEARQPLNPELIEQALQKLLWHHDALRLRFELTETGWQQVNTTPDDKVPFSYIDLSSLLPHEKIQALESTATEIQARLNLSNGPILQVALFDLGKNQPSRVLIVIHHLAVDGISWRILLEDFQTAYQQLCNSKTVKLPAKTTSFQQWAAKLQDYAQSAQLQQEWDYWLSFKSKVEEPHPFSIERRGEHEELTSSLYNWKNSVTLLNKLPIDFPEGENTEASTSKVSIELSGAETQALLQEVPKAYNTQINDILLTALVQTFAEWTGNNSLLVDLEGHGREPIFDDVDISRTVGWFTSVFPVQLHFEPTVHLGEGLKAVKEQLRQIPNRGIGYGILRYLSQQTEMTEKLKKLPQAEVSFNYLGQFDQSVSDSSLFGFASESTGLVHSPRNQRSYLLEINGFVANGELKLDWSYSKAVHRQSTVERLAQGYIEALRSLISHCLSPDAGGYTPSDFPLANIDQLTLNKLVANYRQIQDMYPLSPVQQGMLFHALYDPKSQAYFTQSSCILSGDLNLLAFQKAWQQVINRHPILRTAFIWEGLDTPLQYVAKDVPLLLVKHDWQHLSTPEQQQQLDQFLERDRKQSFNLNQPPLMRLTLIQLAENTYNFIWSHHHLLLDGWSTPLLLKEVLTFYQAFCHNHNIDLELSRPYRDYIAWLQQQNLSEAEAFWRQTLNGFSTPTPLPITGISDGEYYAEHEIKLSKNTTATLESVTRQNQLTLNTLLQGAWALLLSYYSGKDDVVFGTTVSGRPTELVGAELMVGMFINSLPVRVKISVQESLLSWLKQLQTQQVQARQYEYSPLVQIHGWSNVPKGLPLFESILVFENYPVDSKVEGQNQALKIAGDRTVIRNHYPLTVRAAPNAELSLLLMYDKNRFHPDTITRIANHWEALLETIRKQPNLQLSELAGVLLDADKQQQTLKEKEIETATLQKFKRAKRKAIYGS